MRVDEALLKCRETIKVLDEKLAQYEKFGTIEELTEKFKSLEPQAENKSVAEDKSESVVVESADSAFKPRAIRLMESFK